MASFHSSDFSTFDIDTILSRSIWATDIAYSGVASMTSSYIQKCLIPFGKTVVTKIAIFPFTLILSSFNFITQASLHAFVFLDSQTIIHAFCQRLFFTAWSRSAHLIPVGTSAISSTGNACCKAIFKSSS